MNGKLNAAIPSLASNSVYLGMMLAIVGGFTDAYTFISRGGVFANAQTGNMVLLAAKAAEGNLHGALLHIPPILAFILGVLVSETGKLPNVRHVIYSYRRSILILECSVLIIVGFLPESVPNIVVTMCIAFVTSLQISTFNKLDKWAYNSTVTTGNLRTAIQAAYLAVKEHNQEAGKQFKEFLAILISFTFGALSGTFSTVYLGKSSIWIASGVLVAALILYHRDRGYYRRPQSLNN
ncbi:MAG: DUF1275 domain-containing protein [Acidobacteriota bacterium]|jgi:uncharacterized membrane protein YoaK (UPF0700 family)|nr:DUF1275 domain-containing protein [Acidobacteriota bacterium]